MSYWSIIWNGSNLWTLLMFNLHLQEFSFSPNRANSFINIVVYFVVETSKISKNVFTSAIFETFLIIFAKCFNGLNLWTLISLFYFCTGRLLCIFSEPRIIIFSVRLFFYIIFSMWFSTFEKKEIIFVSLFLQVLHLHNILACIIQAFSEDLYSCLHLL